MQAPATPTPAVQAKADEPGAKADAPRPPTVLVRIASMAYEAFLLFAVLFFFAYLTLALLGWTYPLPPARRWTLQAILFAGVGAYFVWCWTRSGQTLAMKTWRMRVVDAQGKLLSTRTAIARYLLAWHLVVPGFAFVLVSGAGPAVASIALPAGAVLLVLLSRLDRRCQLLHDRLLDTRVERVAGPPPPRRTGPPGPSATN